MQCTIPSQNMKILVRGLHSLARIGEDLYIESTEEGLWFRTVNSAQSAYSSLVFYTSFFTSYKSNFKTEVGGKCKLSMRSCLSVFRTPNSMDRNVDSCKVEIDEDCIKVSFQVQFVQGYTKNYLLAVSDNANVQLKYNKNEMCNRMNILSKTLYGAIKHFRSNEDEITLCVKNDRALLRNYIPHGEVGNPKFVRTNLSLKPSEFESYEIDQPGSITFALRELRAVCTLSELSNASPVGIYFEKAGKPVIFSVRNNHQYEADYVISTLPPDMIDGERPHRRSQLSDMGSSVPSTSSGMNREKKRKLAPVAEEEEPPPTPIQVRKSNECLYVPRVSLVDIIKYTEDNRQSPLSKNNSVIEKKQSPLRSVVPIEPDRRSSMQSSRRTCILDTPQEEMGEEQRLSAEEFFPDDVNNDCLNMLCDQVDQISKSQNDRIRNIFQYCFNYSSNSFLFPESEILCPSSDTEC